jgi:hypothetical protein
MVIPFGDSTDSFNSPRYHHSSQKPSASLLAAGLDLPAKGGFVAGWHFGKAQPQHECNANV